MNMLRRKLCVVLCLGLLILLGCKPSGPPVATVKGKFTLAGKALPGGFVTFQSEDGARSVVGEINATGEYEMRTHDSAGLPPGKYKVAVKPPAPVRPIDQPPLAGEATTYEPPKERLIPEKYADVNSSGLTADVTLDAGKSYDFDLQP
jgi:hypothetical protein